MTLPIAGKFVSAYEDPDAAGQPGPLVDASAIDGKLSIDQVPVGISNVVTIPSGATSGVSLGIAGGNNNPSNSRPNGVLSGTTYYMDYRDIAGKVLVFESGTSDVNIQLADLRDIQGIANARGEFEGAAHRFMAVNNKTGGNITFLRPGGIADIRPTSAEGGALVAPGYAADIAFWAHQSDRYALAVNAFKRADSGSGISRSDADSRYFRSSQEIPDNRIPSSIARDSELATVDAKADANKLEIDTLDTKAADLSFTREETWVSAPSGGVVNIAGNAANAERVRQGAPPNGVNYAATITVTGDTILVVRLPLGDWDRSEYRLAFGGQDVRLDNIEWQVFHMAADFIYLARFGAGQPVPGTAPGGYTVGNNVAMRLEHHGESIHTSYSGDVSGAEGMKEVRGEIDTLSKRASDLHLVAEPEWANASGGAGIFLATSIQLADAVAAATYNAVATIGASLDAGQRLFFYVRLPDGASPGDYRLQAQDGQNFSGSSMNRIANFDFVDAASLHWDMYLFQLQVDAGTPAGTTLKLQHHGNNFHTRYDGDVPGVTENADHVRTLDAEVAELKKEGHGSLLNPEALVKLLRGLPAPGANEVEEARFELYSRVNTASGSHLSDPTGANRITNVDAPRPVPFETLTLLASQSGRLVRHNDFFVRSLAPDGGVLSVNPGTGAISIQTSEDVKFLGMYIDGALAATEYVLAYLNGKLFLARARPAADTPLDNVVPNIPLTADVLTSYEEDKYVRENVPIARDSIANRSFKVQVGGSIRVNRRTGAGQTRIMTIAAGGTVYGWTPGADSDGNALPVNPVEGATDVILASTAENPNQLPGATYQLNPGLIVEHRSSITAGGRRSEAAQRNNLNSVDDITFVVGGSPVDAIGWRWADGVHEDDVGSLLAAWNTRAQEVAAIADRFVAAVVAAGDNVRGNQNFHFVGSTGTYMDIVGNQRANYPISLTPPTYDSANPKTEQLRLYREFLKYNPLPAMPSIRFQHSAGEGKFDLHFQDRIANTDKQYFLRQRPGRKVLLPWNRGVASHILPEDFGNWDHLVVAQSSGTRDISDSTEIAILTIDIGTLLARAAAASSQASELKIQSDSINFDYQPSTRKFKVGVGTSQEIHYLALV